MRTVSRFEPSKEFIGPTIRGAPRDNPELQAYTFEEYRSLQTGRYLSKWSQSRSDPLCPRQKYYFEGAGSYGGDHPESPELTRWIASNKKLHSLPLVVGTLVHNVIAHALFAYRDVRRGNPDTPRDEIHEAVLRLPHGVSIEHVVNRALKRFDRYWEASKEHGEAFRENPYLFRYGIHEYAHRYTDQALEIERLDWRERLSNSLYSFYSLVYAPILADKLPIVHWRDVELDADRESSGVPEFKRVIDGNEYTIYAGIDFSFAPKGGEGLRIWDWKTGAWKGDRYEPETLDKFKRAEHDLQAGVYALYARQKWPELTPESIKPRFIYTSLDSTVPLAERIYEPVITEASLQEIESRIVQDVGRMRSAFKPDSDGLYRPKMEDFPTLWETRPKMPPASKEKICGRCTFCGACDRAPRALRDGDEKAGKGVE